MRPIMVVLAAASLFGLAACGDDAPNDQERCDHAREEGEDFGAAFYCERAKDEDRERFHED